MQTSARGPGTLPSLTGVTKTPDTSGAGHPVQTLPPPGPSFARRHPFLAAFGVLAALSLFSAFWPLSAVITGAVVAARATGLDKLAWRGLTNAGRWVRDRVRGEKPPAPPPPAPPPAAPAPQVPARGRALAHRGAPRQREVAGAGARNRDAGTRGL